MWNRVYDRCEAIISHPFHLIGSLSTSLPEAPYLTGDVLNEAALPRLLSGYASYLDLQGPNDPSEITLDQIATPARPVRMGTTVSVTALEDISFVRTPFPRNLTEKERATFGNINDVVHRDLSALCQLERKCVASPPLPKALRLFAWALCHEAEEQMCRSNIRAAIVHIGYAINILRTLKGIVTAEHASKLEAVEGEWVLKREHWRMWVTGVQAGESFIARAEGNRTSRFLPMFCRVATVFYTRVSELAFASGYVVFSHQAFHHGVHLPSRIAAELYAAGAEHACAQGLTRLYEKQLPNHDRIHRAIFRMPFWQVHQDENGEGIFKPITRDLREALEDIALELPHLTISTEDLADMDSVSTPSSSDRNELLVNIFDDLQGCMNALKGLSLASDKQEMIAALQEAERALAIFRAHIDRMPQVFHSVRNIPSSFVTVFPTLAKTLVAYAERLHQRYPDLPTFPSSFEDNANRIGQILSP